jgi:hypothetical protein
MHALLTWQVFSLNLKMHKIIKPPAHRPIEFFQFAKNLLILWICYYRGGLISWRRLWHVIPVLIFYLNRSGYRQEPILPGAALHRHGVCVSQKPGGNA